MPLLKNKSIKIFLLALLFLCGSMLVGHQADFVKIENKPLGKGSVAALSRVYQQWQENQKLKGGSQFLTLPLSNNRGLSSTQALPNQQGELKINLYTGAYTASFKSPLSGSYYLWLEGKQEADTTLITRKLLGQFAESDDKLYHLESQIQRSEMQDIYLSRIIISTDAKLPLNDIQLSGSPSLFQKVFYQNQYWMTAHPMNLALT